MKVVCVKVVCVQVVYVILHGGHGDEILSFLSPLSRFSLSPNGYFGVCRWWHVCIVSPDARYRWVCTVRVDGECE